MKAKVPFICITLALASAEQTFIESKARSLSAFGGFWYGFNMGLYHSSKLVSDECVNLNALARFTDAANYLDGEADAGDIFSFITDTAFVITNLSSCNLRKPSKDISEFCGDRYAHFKSAYGYESKKGADRELNFCNLEEILQNLKSNIFEVMPIFKSFFSLLSDFPAESDYEFRDQCEGLGENLGNLINLSLGFTAFVPI